MLRRLRGARRRWLVVAGIVVLGLGAGAALVLLGTGGDVSNPQVEFLDTDEVVPVAPVPPEPDKPAGDDDAPRRHPADDGFSWPVYGLSKARTHNLPLRRALRPPFRPAWGARGRVLLEFTPVMCRRKLYLLKNNGALYAISRATGRVAWKRKLGTLSAASPACGGGSVYAVLLQRARGARGGRVVAVSARTGRTRWSRPLPSRAESSPLLDRGRLYFGTENGTVYALRARDGAVRWRYRAAGAVKGAPALSGDTLFFGDYGGRLHAIRQRDGARRWSVGTRGGRLGLRSGNFYSSAAVAYGRVYIGNTDGNVYSFAARDGKLAWRKGTGDYVYASPAVARGPRGRPTVYIGSYDGRFYALDARSGRERWSRRLASKISGAATVVGDLVFFSDLGAKSTYALGTATGQTVWKTGRGAFNPVVSDGRRVYFNGYSSLFGLDPRGVRFSARAARRERGRERRRIARRARARAAAQAQRQRTYRTALHGHRHRARRAGPPRCHRHRHTYRLGRRVVVLRHSHCHRHVRRR